MGMGKIEGKTTIEMEWASLTISELLESKSDVSWVIPEGHEAGTVAERWFVAKLSCLSDCSADH